eukprot:10182351-Alexandrium_andersonii.AAC.1
MQRLQTELWQSATTDPGSPPHAGAFFPAGRQSVLQVTEAPPPFPLVRKSGKQCEGTTGKRCEGTTAQ